MGECDKPTAPRDAAGGIAAALGVLAGLVVGIVLGSAARIAAAVAHAAFGRVPPAPSGSTAGGAPAWAPRPGWNTAQPQSVLKPTYWPVVLALGISFILWGLTSSVLITFIGVALFILALINWIGLLRHEA